MRGISSTAVRDDADRLGRAGRRATLDVDEEERLLARPFTTPGGADGTVVVSEPLRPYEQTELYVGLASLLVGLLVVLAVGLITRWVTTRSLAPVRQMAERAADWSEHDLAHRFGLGPPVNELTALGATLDGLLERVARTIRAEQRLTAELAHELRTPLTAIQGAADLALLRGGLDPEVRRDLEQVAGSSRAMARTITTLLELARDPAPGERAACSVGELVAAVGVLVPPGTALEDRTGPARDLRVAAPLDLAVRALAPLVENAARHGRSRVTLSVRAEGASVHLEVGDDGPGVDPQVRERLFAPGTERPGRRHRPGPGHRPPGGALARRRGVARRGGRDRRRDVRAAPAPALTRPPAVSSAGAWCWAHRRRGAPPPPAPAARSGRRSATSGRTSSARRRAPASGPATGCRGSRSA